MTRDESKLRLPEGATKVFTGVIYDVYHWPQEVYDGSLVTFEKIARNDSAEIIATNSNGEFYINKEKQPGREEFLDLPAGRIEINEDRLMGAKRELEEETALISDNWQELYQFKPSTNVDWTIYTFNAKDCKPDGIISLDPGEIIVTEAVNKKQFIEVLMDEKFRAVHIKLKFLEHYYNNSHDDWLDSLI